MFFFLGLSGIAPFVSNLQPTPAHVGRRSIWRYLSFAKNDEKYNQITSPIYTLTTSYRIKFTTQIAIRPARNKRKPDATPFCWSLPKARPNTSTHHVIPWTRSEVRPLAGGKRGLRLAIGVPLPRRLLSRSPHPPPAPLLTDPTLFHIVSCGGTRPISAPRRSGNPSGGLFLFNRGEDGGG